MQDDERPPRIAENGPTEVVEDDRGELVERLSAGTATLLLAWLIGTGAASALVAVWLLAALLWGLRLGLGELFSGLGLYVAIFGASGPTVLWLAGRAQGHSLAWFAWTAAKIGLVMIGTVLAIGLLAALMIGLPLAAGAPLAAGILVVATLLLSLIWALTVWSADRYIARARIAN
jgi:hypothetical protein